MAFSLRRAARSIGGAFRNTIGRYGGTAAKLALAPGAAVTERLTGVSMLQQAQVGASIGGAGMIPGVGPPPSANMPTTMGRTGMPFNLSSFMPQVTGPGGFASQVLREVAIPALAQRFLPRQAAPAPGPAMMPVPASMPGATPTAAGVGAMARGAAAGVRMILAKASAWLGRRVTRKNVVALTKRIGIEATAVALGLTIFEVATVIATTPARRARGISAGDVKRTKRTLRKLSSLACNFQEYCSTSKSLPRRKKVCR